MEIKIRDMQQGGYMPPFTYYQPVLVNDQTTRQYAYNIGGDGLYNSSSRSSSSSSSKSDDESKGRITQKDLMAMLEKVDGLPSDMKSIFNELMEFEKLQDIPFVSSMIGDLSTQYISTLQDIKQANFNKKLFDNAYELLAKKNALDEIAINKNGNVFVEDPENGLPKEVSVDEYASGNYNAYTNSNLLYLRANTLPNNNRIFDIANNAISMQNINSLIHDYLSRIGTSENSTSVYEKRQGQKIQQGLDNIQAIEDEVSESGVDGLYKSKNLTKQQKIQGAQAIEYIWNMLPKNAQTLLKIKAKEMGAKTDDVLVRLFVGSSLSDTVENTDTLLLDSEGKKLGSKGSSSSGSGSDKGMNLSPTLAFLSGLGYSQDVEFNVGNSVSFKAKGRYGILTDKSGNPIGAGHSLKDINNGQYAGILDFDNATFAGSRINWNQSDNTILKNADVIGVDLPIDIHAEKGVIRPDISMMGKIEKADEQILINNISNNDYEKINEIYVQNGLPSKYVKDANGKWILNQTQYARFAAVQATVDGNILTDYQGDIPKDIINDNLVEEIQNSVELDNIERILKTRDGNSKYSIDQHDWSSFLFGYDKIYRGTIFIPVREHALISSTLVAPSAGQLKYPISDVQTMDQMQQSLQQQHQIDPQSNYIKPPSLSTL